mgnify:CR=1 FL=1
MLETIDPNVKVAIQPFNSKKVDLPDKITTGFNNREKLMDVLKFKSRIQSLHDDRLFQFHLNSFQRAWNRSSEKAGHGWAGVHDLRHFFCSFLLNNDVDHMTVATLSGHKSLKVLKDRYGHYDDQTLERAMSVFDRILGLDSRKSPAGQK